MPWLDFALHPFPDLFDAPRGEMSVKVKDTLVKARLTDRQIGVAYHYLIRTNYDVMGGMLGLATYPLAALVAIATSSAIWSVAS